RVGVGPAPTAGAGGGDLDADQRRRVPRERAIGLGLVGRNREGGDIERRDPGPLHARYSFFGNIARNACSMMPRASGSPLSSACVNDFACSSVMCGGSGGTSGSTI